MEPVLVTEWFTKHSKSIKGLLVTKHRLQKMCADDIIQEIFLRLLRYDSQRIVENPMAYLYRIASNVLSEQSELSRNCKTHYGSDWLEDQELEADLNLEEILQDEQFQQYIQSLIDSLPYRRRSTLLLHVDGKTYKEIAAELNISERMVLRDLVRAYSTLRTIADPNLR